MPILRIIYCATGIYSSVFAGVGTKTGFWIRIYRVQRDVAQFGRALRSGRKGRRFKSCHPDHTADAAGISAAFFKKWLKSMPDTCASGDLSEKQS